MKKLKMANNSNIAQTLINLWVRSLANRDGWSPEEIADLKRNAEQQFGLKEPDDNV